MLCEDQFDFFFIEKRKKTYLVKNMKQSEKGEEGRACDHGEAEHGAQAISSACLFGSDIIGL